MQSCVLALLMGNIIAQTGRMGEDGGGASRLYDALKEQRRIVQGESADGGVGGRGISGSGDGYSRGVADCGAAAVVDGAGSDGVWRGGGEGHRGDGGGGAEWGEAGVPVLGVVVDAAGEVWHVVEKPLAAGTAVTARVGRLGV